jgi:ribosomal peptide maturation radical SAM protein 1
MPWTIVKAPSIQIGTLKAILDNAGIRTHSAHLYLKFFDMLARKLKGKRISVDKFESFGELLGEWTFSVSPFRTVSARTDDMFSELLQKSHHKEWVDLAFRVREAVPEFLNQCVEEVLAYEPKIVGFSTTFQQNVPSLVLSKMLKERRPNLRIVFGGANCEGEMGQALHRVFPWIDVVVRGEGERVVVKLFRELVEGKEISEQPGLCFRKGSEIVVCKDTPIDDREKRPAIISLSASPAVAHRTDELGPQRPVPMDSIPLPIYDEYFDRLEKTLLKEQDDQIWLPYESARGCWWAIKHVCTFCAANAQYLSFRSRTPEKVASDVTDLSRRYGSRRVWFVDNIMEERYLRELFPVMCETPVPMFVETRAHVSKEQLRTMRDAGVVMVQLGIESLSSPILKLMEKGTTAIQNVRVIKWCAELGIRAFYNILYGFPGESAEEYARMADAVLSLTHLEPPNPPVRLRLDRFSPYHRDPERFGIEVLGPYQIRHLTYDLPTADLSEIEYFFEFRYKDQRNPNSYVEQFVRNCADWKANWRQNFCRLSYHPTGSGLRIYDTRLNMQPILYELGAAEARIYLACEAGTTARKVWNALSSEEQHRFSVEEVTNFLVAMTRQRLMFTESDRFLSLAVEGNERLRSMHEKVGALTVQPLLINGADCLVCSHQQA